MKAPLSLHVRLALLAVLMVCAALAVTTYMLGDLVTTVISDNMDIPLDAQIRTLRHAIGSDGKLDETKLSFDLRQPAPGWGWHVKTAHGEWKKSMPDERLEYLAPRIHPVDGIYSGRDAATQGDVVHARREDLPGGVQDASIIVAAPQMLIQQPLERVRAAIRQSVLFVLTVLVAACGLQLHFGLRPLRQLGAAIAHIRSGQAQALPELQPVELAPLAQEVNALIARNNAGLETARLNAANLAHAVKTPLSTLMIQLEHEEASPEARALVAHISQRVTHHLRRARSAAIGMGERARADVHDAVEGIRPVVASLGQGRLLHIENRVEPPCPVSVDVEDLSEMLGNLMENACRYARSHIRVDAQGEGRWLTISIIDDGKGIPQDQLHRVLQPGVRLDEVAEGYGLGLAITRELAEMYDGRLVLGAASTGTGLHARLILPR